MCMDVVLVRVSVINSHTISILAAPGKSLADHKMEAGRVGFSRWGGRHGFEITQLLH